MKNLLLLGCAGGLLFFASSATAADANGTLTVTGSVAASCTVSAAPLAFAAEDVLDANPTDATADITVTCTNGTDYDIGLDAGSGAGADTTTRVMTATDASGDTLSYQLFQDAGYTTNWGEADAVDTVTDTGDGTAQTHTVYGRIPTGQETAPPKNYSDTVAINVTY